MSCPTSVVGPWLPRSNRTEMGRLTEGHRPRINGRADSRRQPSLSQTGSRLRFAAIATMFVTEGGTVGSGRFGDLTRPITSTAGASRFVKMSSWWVGSKGGARIFRHNGCADFRQLERRSTGRIVYEFEKHRILMRLCSRSPQIRQSWLLPDCSSRI